MRQNPPKRQNHLTCRGVCPVLAAATESSLCSNAEAVLAKQEARALLISHSFAAGSISRKEIARLFPSQPSCPPSPPSVICSCSGLSWVYLLLALQLPPGKQDGTHGCETLTSHEQHNTQWWCCCCYSLDLPLSPHSRSAKQHPEQMEKGCQRLSLG